MLGILTLITGLLIAYNFLWFILNMYNLSLLSVKKKPSRLNPRGGFKLLRKRTKLLPKISVLLPAYKEGKIIEKSVDALYHSNYPKNKFEVLILLERDDPETIKVAKELSKKYKNVKFAIVKSKLYKTKPNALNYGLPLTNGDIIGVIDAEDIVEKNLLLKVAYAIWFKGYHAVQGVLDMANDADGWKNLMQRAEYAFWFRRVLPGLEYLGLPIPFGGSTNFFRKDFLISIGGWKPANLTEDFELGIRIYHHRQRVLKDDGKVKVIHSITLEESPTSWDSWLRQRTRWQQGKIQTAREYISKIDHSYKSKIYTYMALLQPHVGGITLSGVIISILALLMKVTIPTPIIPIIYFNFVFIFIYGVTHGISYINIAKSKKKINSIAKLIIISFTMPAYWLWQWIADIRALKREYIDKNKSWEKTEHKGRHFAKKKTIE